MEKGGALISLFSVYWRISNCNCSYRVAEGLVEACPRLMPANESGVGADGVIVLAAAAAANYSDRGELFRHNKEALPKPLSIYVSSEPLGEINRSGN